MRKLRQEKLLCFDYFDCALTILREASDLPWVVGRGLLTRYHGQDQDRWSKWENKGGEVVIMPQRLAHKQKHALPLDLLVLSAHDLKTLRFT